jgi:hypothetical protein
MSQHYQKWVTETLAWCAQCGRETRHHVSGGRLGHCLDHERRESLTKKQQRAAEQREREKQNPKLF